MNDAERLARWRARQRAEFGRFDEPVDDDDEGLSEADVIARREMRAYVLGEDRQPWIH